MSASKPKKLHQAVAYFRTSSVANVGRGKDSDKRQRLAVANYAKAKDIQIMSEFYDADVSGGINPFARERFADTVQFCQDHGIDMILCENVSRFSRDIAGQEQAAKELEALGLTIVPVDMPDVFRSDADHTRKMIRQIMGVIAEYEKEAIKVKLEGARRRKALSNKKDGILTRTGKGKCEGRKRLDELDPRIKAEAKRLRRINPKTKKRRSFRDVSAELANLGYTNGKGNPLTASQVQRLVG